MIRPNILADRRAKPCIHGHSRQDAYLRANGALACRECSRLRAARRYANFKAGIPEAAKPGRPPKLLPDQTQAERDAYVIAAYDVGKSMEEIGWTVQLTRGGVSGILLRHGIPIVRKRERASSHAG